MAEPTTSPSTITPEEFVTALRELRRASGLSIRALSKTTGVPTSTLGGYFSGRHAPTHQASWELLLGVLGVVEEQDRSAWVEAARRVLRQKRAAGRVPGPRPHGSSGPSDLVRHVQQD